MKSFILQIFLMLRGPIDFVLSIFTVPAAFLLLTYRRIGSARLPLTTRLLKRIGLFPIRNHYYEPLFDDRQLVQLLSKERILPGIDMNVAFQLSFMERLSYSSELLELRFDEQVAGHNTFHFNNGSFESGDAEFLYQFIRDVKPAKVIEIGCGNSTKVANIALMKNISESKQRARHICIEPYEQPWLEGFGNIELVRKRIEDCEYAWENELKEGDLLFIDSSHVIRPQGDVLLEYLEILPKLASGVFVHIHDIFTPRDYLHTLVVDDVKFWNEQYLLEALLSNTNRYEVIAAINFLKHNYYHELNGVCPYLTEEREPGSFYIRVR